MVLENPAPSPRLSDWKWILLVKRETYGVSSFDERWRWKKRPTGHGPCSPIRTFCILGL
jgi:hypothetical protein